MLDIVDLTDIARPADREPFHRALAQLHAAEWAHLYDPTVWNEDIAAAEFAGMSAEPGVPRTLLAFDGPERSLATLAGSVCLLASDDLAGWNDVGPWLASLWVMPHARGRGVGATLTARCVALAGELGHDEVFLFTAGQEAYYATRGWRPAGTATANGTPAAVMVRRTSPNAARRSVASTWSGNPDIAGAYSFLRPGGTSAHRDALGEEAAPGLWFAGEHTWSASPGTMHGAWFSGERAAAAVIAEGHRRAVVVGAGLAGLAAAARLREGGLDVRVLEAGPRPGGRAATDRTIGVPLHLGGAWLHGTIGHPLAGLDSVAWSWARTTTFVAGSGALPVAQQRRLQQIDAAIEHDLATAAATDAADHPLGPVVRRSLAARAVEPLDRAVVGAWIRGSYENLYAAPLDELSLRNRAEPYHLPGGDRLITSGIDEFVDELAGALDVRVGHRVVRIERDAAAWRVVDAKGETYAADAVVVAVPIVVLQRARISFEPPLPDSVLAAMGAIGCGPVAKVFATFDTAFWSPHRAFWVVGEERLPLELFVDVTPLAGSPTLCGFAVGEHAAAVEAMTEGERCRLVDDLLAIARVSRV